VLWEQKRGDDTNRVVGGNDKESCDGRGEFWRIRVAVEDQFVQKSLLLGLEWLDINTRNVSGE